MNNIGAIGASYTPNVQPHQPKENSQQNVQSEQKQSSQAQQSNVKPDDVLNYMAANTGVNINKSAPATKVIKISDYVTPEQAKRIAGFVTGFESEIAKGLGSIQNEFPEMSDEMAQAFALASFELGH
ncbi:hypothetical protein J6Q66_04100 [bacterium]|nr:hypothetical protein [bacterium]